MERETSPSASTPATFQALTEEDFQDTIGQVPSPKVDSDLKDSNQSTILENSLEELSMETQGDSHMEMVSTMEPTMMEVGEDTPEPTPLAKRTRSHDGEKLYTQQPVTPHPRVVFDNLMKHIVSEMQVAKKQNESKKKKSHSKEEAPGKAVEAVEEEDTLKSYTGLNETEKAEEDFTLVDLEDVEEEVEKRDRKKFFRILDK